MRSEVVEMFATRRVASSRGVEEAREALSDVFLPIDFPSARPSDPMAMELNALRVGQVTCGYMRFRDAVRIQTAEAQNFHVDIPTVGRAMMRAGLGTPVYGTQQAAGVFMPGRPVELDCDDHFAQLSLMFPRESLQLELAALLGEQLPRPLEFSAELDLATPGGQMVLHSLQLIDDASRRDDGGPLAYPLVTQRLEQVLMHSLLFSQPHNYSSTLAGPAPASGTTPVSRAVEAMRSSPAHPWTVGELAAEVSVSVRSLQEGFRRSLDTTPMAYLRCLRLQRVHDDLESAEPGSTRVTEVAARWGFVHLGRFAAAYQREFGERPSDTVRSQGRRAG
ncbi:MULTISPECIES: AraC family transcriptional regulator [unclassified Leifsonia]|uniref:AraC family transcriptional regulator n=1 Tax=unclassified Leifsonia TaxID=2663824 RepID=UPI000381FA73|nr:MULTISPECIES: AraC family transcriptional regulator [unclassified Leifsonia]